MIALSFVAAGLITIFAFVLRELDNLEDEIGATFEGFGVPIEPFFPNC